MPTQRQLRVNNLLQSEISDIVRRELNDPHIGFFTITDAEVSADLRHARIFVSVLGDDKVKRETIRALIRARHVIRGFLGERLEMRYIPGLIFRLDDTAERAQKMEVLLAEVAAETPDDDDPETE